MKKLKITFILILFGVSSLFALEVPALGGRINDNADILSSAVEDRLESYLASVENTVGAQIAFLSISSLEGESLESYSFRVAETWGLGSSGRDDGALLLVAVQEKELRIEVGYGLEAVLTDAMSGFIIREAIIPEFKRGDWNAGVEAGLTAMGGVVTGDTPISTAEVEKSASSRRSGITVSPMLVMFLLFFVFSRMGGYRRMRRRGMSPGSAIFMGMLLGGGRRRGGGFGSSSGGFGGGGFSGGGGSFGGGGASGGW